VCSPTAVLFALVGAIRVPRPTTLQAASIERVGFRGLLNLFPPLQAAYAFWRADHPIENNVTCLRARRPLVIVVEACLPDTEVPS
jgi:hypothetical protein